MAEQDPTWGNASLIYERTSKRALIASKTQQSSGKLAFHAQSTITRSDQAEKRVSQSAPQPRRNPAYHADRRRRNGTVRQRLWRREAQWRIARKAWVGNRLERVPHAHGTQEPDIGAGTLFEPSPQGNGKLRGSGDYGMPNSVPNTIDPPYHPKRSRTQSCYIAGSESPHGKPRGAASSARPSAPDRTGDCKADPPCDRPRANPDISATSVQQPLLPRVNMAGSKDGTALRSTTERRRARWHSSWLSPRWSCSF